MIKETKNSIRNRILNLLRNQKEDDRRKKSLVILRKLFARKEFKKAKTILFYASFDGEVETFEMMRQARKLGKKIALPAILREPKTLVPLFSGHAQEEDLSVGPYNIRQPHLDKSQAVELKDLDLVIVPGVAFDRDNNRLGRGAGYYDRFLKSLPCQTASAGLAFDFQVVDFLPQNSFDVPVSQVITN